MLNACGGPGSFGKTPFQEFTDDLAGGKHIKSSAADKYK